MKTYVSLFILSTLLSVFLTPVAQMLARRLGIVDYPDGKRRFHNQPVPRLGGVAIFLSFILTLAIVPLLNNLVAEQLRWNSDQLLRLLVPCGLVFLLGIYDDVRGADAKIKFTVQILASVLLYALGLRITHVWHPFGGIVELGVWALPLTVLWLVGITNAFNLIDGLDGLSAGAALFAILTVLVVALIHGHPLVVIMSIALAGATFGFLRYNFAPASIFMGDSGSLFLGFLIAALSLEGSQKSTTAVAVAIPIVSLGLPILDTVWAITRRLIGKRPIFTGDREHIHHMIVKRGLSIRQSIILLYGICAAFALFSLLFLNPNGQIMGLILFIVGFCIFLGIQRLGYHELTELRYALRKLWSQRHVVAANITVRRAASHLREAESLGALLTTLEEMLSGNDFDRVELNLQSILPQDDRILEAARGCAAEQAARLSLEPDMLVWTWQRSGGPQRDAARCWRLMVPLATTEGVTLGSISFLRSLDRPAHELDFHHVCTFLQQELSRTLERIRALERLTPSALVAKTRAAASGID